MSGRATSILVVATVLALAPLARAADDPAKLEEAKALVETMEAQRKAEDSAGLAESIGKLVDLHNGLEDKGARGKLQKELGSVLKEKDVADAHGAAVEALGALNDDKGAWKELKRVVPGPKDEEFTELQGKALAAAGKLAPDAAIDTLLELSEKAKNNDAGAAAIEALGGFKGSKKRTAILEELVKLIGRFQPPTTGTVGEATKERWTIRGPALVKALNALTGQKAKEPGEWLLLYKDHKKKLDGLFVE
jgi:hypothetical protein